MEKKRISTHLYKLDGHGQCHCKRCGCTNWTSFCYMIKDKVVCGSCLSDMMSELYVSIGGIMEKVYIASPFFNDEQLKRVEMMEDRLRLNHIDFFSPRLEQAHTEDGHFNGPAIFKNNVDSINSCTTLVAIIDDKDTGTAFEIGYALAQGKRVILVMHQDERVSKTNIMLACAGPIVMDKDIVAEINHENDKYIYIVGDELE